jgi:hypothetical protein
VRLDVENPVNETHELICWLMLIYLERNCKNSGALAEAITRMMKADLKRKGLDWS